MANKGGGGEGVQWVENVSKLKRNCTFGIFSGSSFIINEHAQNLYSAYCRIYAPKSGRRCDTIHSGNYTVTFIKYTQTHTTFSESNKNHWGIHATLQQDLSIRNKTLFIIFFLLCLIGHKTRVREREDCTMCHTKWTFSQSKYFVETHFGKPYNVCYQWVENFWNWFLVYC